MHCSPRSLAHSSLQGQRCRVPVLSSNGRPVSWKGCWGLVNVCLLTFQRWDGSGSPAPKLADRWKSVVWLGKSDLTDEHLVRTDEGVVHARSARRLAEHSWSEEKLRAVVETPRKPKSTTPEIPPAADPSCSPTCSASMKMRRRNPQRSQRKTKRCRRRSIFIFFDGEGMGSLLASSLRWGYPLGRLLAWSSSGPEGSGWRRRQLCQGSGLPDGPECKGKAEQPRWHTAADKHHHHVPILAISNLIVGRSRKNRAMPNPLL